MNLCEVPAACQRFSLRAIRVAQNDACLRPQAFQYPDMRRSNHPTPNNSYSMHGDMFPGFQKCYRSALGAPAGQCT